jgi:hypothetical protein
MYSTVVHGEGQRRKRVAPLAEIASGPDPEVMSAAAAIYAFTVIIPPASTYPPPSAIRPFRQGKTNNRQNLNLDVLFKYSPEILIFHFSVRRLSPSSGKTS